MNDPKIYLPISIIIVLSIVHLSLSVPSFSLILNFPRFLYLSAFLSILTAGTVYLSYKNRFDFDNLYKLTASTVLFSFVVWLAGITLFNKYYTTKNCQTSSYKVVGYTGRYTSGLGTMEKDKIKANQWIISIVKNNKVETFVLDRNIPEKDRTIIVDLEFCKGLLGSEYLNLEEFTE